MLRVDPAQRHRLIEIIDNLRERIQEAQTHGWLGEVQGLQVSLDAAEAKLGDLDHRAARVGPIGLGIPTISDSTRQT
jgi:hypothetical protein